MTSIILSIIGIAFLMAGFARAIFLVTEYAMTNKLNSASYYIRQSISWLLIEIGHIFLQEYMSACIYALMAFLYFVLFIDAEYFKSK